MCGTVDVWKVYGVSGWFATISAKSCVFVVWPAFVSSPDVGIKLLVWLTQLCLGILAIVKAGMLGVVVVVVVGLVTITGQSLARNREVEPRCQDLYCPNIPAPASGFPRHVCWPSA